jgi:hypothetical protein
LAIGNLPETGSLHYTRGLRERPHLRAPTVRVRANRPDCACGPPSAIVISTPIGFTRWGCCALAWSGPEALQSGSGADIAKAVAYAKRIKVYPLSQAANPPPPTFLDAIDGRRWSHLSVNNPPIDAMSSPFAP